MAFFWKLNFHYYYTIIIIIIIIIIINYLFEAFEGFENLLRFGLQEM